MTGNAWIALAGVMVSIFGGGLTMAWRLGGLERSVKDLAEDVRGLQKAVWPRRRAVGGHPFPAPKDTVEK